VGQLGGFVCRLILDVYAAFQKPPFVNDPSNPKKEGFWNIFADPLTPLMSSDTTSPKQPLDDTNAKTASSPSHRLQLSLKAKKTLVQPVPVADLAI
jgi:hypothetical protein